MNEAVAILQRIAKVVEFVSFVIAAVLGVLATGNLGSATGKDAVIAGAVGAAAHGITHTTGGTT